MSSVLGRGGESRMSDNWAVLEKEKKKKDVSLGMYGGMKTIYPVG